MNTTKDVNEELESDKPVWCSEHGRWECEEHGERCQHGNLLDDGCDKCVATAEWFDNLSAQRDKAGTEDVRVVESCSYPASVSVPSSNLSAVPVLAEQTTEVQTGARDHTKGYRNECSTVGGEARESNKQIARNDKFTADSRDGRQPLLLRYPVWDMTFSEYGDRNGWELP